MPVAFSCSLVPSARELLGAVIAIDTRAGWPTAIVAELAIDPEVPVMVAVPTPDAVASPAFVMESIPCAEVLQLIAPLTSFVLASVKVPIAVICRLAPKGREAVPGASDNAASAGGKTVRLARPVILLKVAEMLALPWLRVLVSPPLTVAIAVAEELHTAEPVKFLVLPSE